MKWKGYNKTKEDLKSYWISLAKRSKSKNIEFNLSYKDLENLVFNPGSHCYYCGSKAISRSSYPSKTSINKLKKGKKPSKHFKKGRKRLGLDRIDNNKGYTRDNVVPCCIKCNRAKYTYTEQEFLDWAYQLVKYQQEKGGRKKGLTKELKARSRQNINPYKKNQRIISL